MNDQVENLIRALYQAVGNKVYMRDMERLLREKLKDADPNAKQAMRFLAADLNQLQIEISRAKRGF